MSNADDYFHESSDEVALRMGPAAKPLDAAVTLRHHVKDGNELVLGGELPGRVAIVDEDGEVLASMHAQKGGSLVLGRGGVAGITLAGETADAIIGGTDNAPGDLYVRGHNNQDVITARGGDGMVQIGGNGTGGEILVQSQNETWAFRVQSDFDDGSGAADTVRVKVGGRDRSALISIRNDSNSETIRINGQDGDIEFFNADFAEEFELEEAAHEGAVPGTVMVLNDDGRLRACDDEYSSAVVGVVAGMGEYRPALVLDKQQGPNRRPIAMVGKVRCLVDATQEPIRVGDLLTTSGRPGHAMKVVDRGRALGAVIGKALSPLSSGVDSIRILVTLQ